MHTSQSFSFNIIDSTFTNNSAVDDGGVTVALEFSSFNIIHSSFYANRANSSGGTMLTIECSICITDGIFDHNSESLYIIVTRGPRTRAVYCHKSLAPCYNYNIIQNHSI